MNLPNQLRPEKKPAGPLIRKGSGLAATGWRDGNQFRIWLFYQGPDNAIRWSTFASERNKWSESYEATLVKDVMPGTPLAVTAEVGYDEPKISVGYYTTRSTLEGWSFQGALTPSGGEPQELNTYDPLVEQTSRMSAYWPWYISQNEAGNIQIYNGLPGTVALPSRALWTEFNTPGTRPCARTGLVVLPTTSFYLNAVGFLYVDDDGMLRTFIFQGGDAAEDWSWGTSTETGIHIPRGVPIGAFVYLHHNHDDDDELINTFVLFQHNDDDDNIYTAYQNGTSSWRGPTTHPALAGADPGTDIACVTMGLWSPNRGNLSPETDMNRCYFQAAGGRVKEVWHDGAEWHDLGFLPI